MSKPGAFKEYLREISPHLTLRLIEKAYRANRLAKITSGESKMILYRIKHTHLSKAVELRPDWFHIDSSTRIGKKVVLGLTSRVGFAFHIPKDRLLIRTPTPKMTGTEM